MISGGTDFHDKNRTEINMYNVKACREWHTVSTSFIFSIYKDNTQV